MAEYRITVKNPDGSRHVETVEGKPETRDRLIHLGVDPRELGRWVYAELTTRVAIELQPTVAKRDAEVRVITLGAYSGVPVVSRSKWVAHTLARLGSRRKLPPVPANIGDVYTTTTGDRKPCSYWCAGPTDATVWVVDTEARKYVRVRVATMTEVGTP